MLVRWSVFGVTFWNHSNVWRQRISNDVCVWPNHTVVRRQQTPLQCSTRQDNGASHSITCIRTDHWKCIAGRLILWLSFRFQTVLLFEFQGCSNAVLLDTCVCSQTGICDILCSRIFNFHFQQSIPKTSKRWRGKQCESSRLQAGLKIWQWFHCHHDQ